MKAQIALINLEGWAVIGYLERHTGLFPHPMPAVDSPVLDTRRVSPECVHSIVQRHVPGPEGVQDVDALIEELLEAGAECTALQGNAVCMPEQSCRVCQLAARKAYGDAIPVQMEASHNSALID